MSSLGTLPMTKENGGSSASSASAASASAPADPQIARVMRGPGLLSETDDVIHLSSVLCLVRRQLEFFVATEQDEQFRRAKGGLTRPIVPGRVGIRCIHCSHLPHNQRAKSHSSFPNGISLVNQAVRNYQRYHLPHCRAIPQEVLDEYEISKKDSRIKPKNLPEMVGRPKIPPRSMMKYWEECCRRRGLVDCGGGEGIRFGANDDAATLEVHVEQGADATSPVDSSVSFGAAAANRSAAEIAQEAIHDADNIGGVSDASAAMNHAPTDIIAGPMPSSEIARRRSSDHSSLHAFDELLLDDGTDVALMQNGGSPWEPVPLVLTRANGSSIEESAKPESSHIALREWVSTEMVQAMSLHGNRVLDADRYYLFKAANLALALSTTVARYHEARLAFGGSLIGIETLLVSPGGTDHPGGECDVQMYNVSIKENEEEFEPPMSISNFEEDVWKDLFNVGIVLYEIFSGAPPFREGKTSCDAIGAIKEPKRMKRGSSPGTVNTECVPLRDLGLPVAIDALVMPLVNLGDFQSCRSPFRSARDVVDNVQQMVIDPDRYLFDIGDGCAPEITNTVDISHGKLYGRDADTALLMSAFDRTICKGGPVEAVTVSGYSGIGKTSLVLQLRQPTIERGGFFISGKFDTLRQTRPLSAITSALDAFCDDLVLRQNTNAGTFVATRSAIQEALGDDSGAIVKLIPNLCKIIPLKPDANKVQGRRRSSLDDDDVVDNDDTEIDAKALNRFMFLFRKFFSAIASPLHPVVLFIDDLQWADAMSLDLIRSIVCESDVQSFMFVGSYRSNEIDQDHPLIPHLDQIRTAGIPLLNLELANMDRSSINAMISDTLKLSPLLTRPLADAVYAKTSGNCLFVIELLSDLHRQGLLRYSVSSRRWEWDDEVIAALDIQANVVDLMRRKLLRLGATEMWSVKVAACLGAETKGSTLDLLSFGLGLTPENGLVTLLRRPLEEGLLMKVGPSYRFSHDQIQQAAYSLVSMGDRSSFHLRLGKSLLKAAIATKCLEADSLVLFTCVDQLNRGLSEVNDRKTKIIMAQLNLQAAKKSIASSTFLAASIYLRFALGHLDESDWESNYSLCLEIYTTLSETEYVTGKYEEMTMVLNEIFARARSFDDKLRAYYTLTSATGAQNDMKTAIRTGMEVLEQLEEPIEKEVDMATVMKEVMSAKNLIAGKNEEFFIKHYELTDRRKRYAMKFLNLIVVFVSAHEGMKLPLLACQMIHLTYKFGLCKESAIAFGLYGVTCCGFLGEFAEGYRMGKIAAAIVDRFQANDIFARCNFLIYGWINIWTEPLQATLPQLLEGHNRGVSSGDPDFALMCMRFYIANAFECGRSLSELSNDCSCFVKDCKQHHIEMLIALNKPTWQCIQNLIGDPKQDDPTVLTGEVMDEEQYLNAQIEGGNHTAICYHYLLRLFLAYIFGRYEVAAQMYQRCFENGLPKHLMSRFGVCSCVFYGGLTALEMANIDPNNPKWLSVFEDSMSKMKKWAMAAAWNCEHKLALLQAEKLRNVGDQGAVEAFERAARLANEHGFLHEAAIAYERCGIFLLAMGSGSSARNQYNKAYDAYLRWGALRKCEDIRDKTGNY